MADKRKTPARTTSHAKTIDQDARARSIMEAFNKQAAGRQREPVPDRQRPANDTHAPAAQQHFRPKGAARRAVDRQIDREQQAREDRRAREINDALQKTQDLGPDPSRDFTRGR